MKLFVLLIFVIFAIISSKAECDLEHLELKNAHYSFFEKALGMTMVEYTSALENLQKRFADFKNSMDPKCLNDDHGKETILVLERLDKKFQMILQFEEKHKNVYFNMENVRCFKKIVNDLQTCQFEDVEDKDPASIDFCDGENASKFLECTKKLVGEKCDIQHKDDFYDVINFVLKYSKEHEYCGEDHMIKAIFKYKKN